MKLEKGELGESYGPLGAACERTEEIGLAEPLFRQEQGAGFTGIQKRELSARAGNAKRKRNEAVLG